MNSQLKVEAAVPVFLWLQAEQSKNIQVQNIRFEALDWN
jgi:hypothetical protein